MELQELQERLKVLQDTETLWQRIVDEGLQEKPETDWVNDCPCCHYVRTNCLLECPMARFWNPESKEPTVCYWNKTSVYDRWSRSEKPQKDSQRVLDQIKKAIEYHKNLIAEAL
jgi:hypothetical protein